MLATPPCHRPCVTFVKEEFSLNQGSTKKVIPIIESLIQIFNFLNTLMHEAGTNSTGVNPTEAEIVVNPTAQVLRE